VDEDDRGRQGQASFVNRRADRRTGGVWAMMSRHRHGALHRRVSIGCASAYPSIETFSAVLTWFFGGKGKVDANVLA
jgi:hypothetical protein